MRSAEQLRIRMLNVATPFGFIMRICLAKNPATGFSIIAAGLVSPGEDAKVRSCFKLMLSFTM